MPVKVKCKGCSTILKAPDRARGKAIKCPKCGQAVRIPAESSSRAPQKQKQKQRVAGSAADADDDDFLGGFDLGRVEDRTSRVCPKCGAIVGEEDVDCPSCGADVMTGGLGRIQRIRSKRKGAAPEEYYSRAAGDAGSYLLDKMKLVWKSALILTIFPILALLAIDMFIWCHNWPPEMFWLFVAAVCILFAPGWLWYVQNQFVLRVLQPKRERYPVRMEAFSAISLGVKAFCWSLFFGLPIWVVFGIPSFLLASGGSATAAGFTMLAGVVLFGGVLLICWPIVQAHFAMPITLPGWMIHKVFSDVTRNLGPSLYAAAIAFGTGLLLAGAIAGAAVVSYPKQKELTESLARNSEINQAAQIAARAKENGEQAPKGPANQPEAEGPKIPWKNMLWPMAAQIPIAIVLSFWLVYNARMTSFYVKLFRPNIEHLKVHEKEYVYEKRSELEQEKLEEARGPLTANSVKTAALLGIVFSVLGGVGLALPFGDVFGYAGSFGLAISAVAAILNFVAFVLILIKAFKTSIGWGVALLVPIVNTFAFFMFVSQESKRVVYDFQLWMIAAGMSLLAWVLFRVQNSLISGGEEKKEAAGEAGRQALLMAENVVRFLC